MEIPSHRPLALADLGFPGSLRVAVTAPHPDDFDAIGVTLRWFHSNGNPIILAVLTTGVSGVDDGYAGASTPEAKALVREEEQRASCRMFGLDLSQLTFLRLAADGHGKLSLGDENRGAVRDFLLRARPDIVFLPHGKDTNTAHQRAHQIVEGIVESEQLSVLLCLNEDPKTVEIRRDLVVEFGETEGEWKTSLLRTHASQQSRNLRTRGFGFDERVLAANRRSADLAGAKARYAECFELALYRKGQRAEER